jgi:putative endonuclease
MSNSTNSIGKLGESIACTHLKERGFKIVEQNWRFGKKEIDLIAEYQDYIVFVEVKTREDEFPGRIEEFVNRKKQRHIIAAAGEYMRQNDIEKEARFDVITIVLQGPGKELNHIEGAFYPTL